MTDESNRGSDGEVLPSAISARFYAFHGLTLAISGPARVCDRLHARLRRFALEKLAPPDLHFELLVRPDGGFDVDTETFQRARPVYESPLGQVLYDDAVDRLLMIHDGRTRVVCDPADGRTSIAVAPHEPDKDWLVSHPFFTIPFIECLKRRGRYNLHASGVCVDGMGILFPGGSGSGKSTLSIALARVGLGFLGDDMTFIARGAGGLRVLAFPDEIDVTEQTAAFFPELAFLLDRPKPAGWHKRQFLIEEVYTGAAVASCEPVAQVFPRIASTPQSTLQPMGRDEALREILPNVLLTDAASAQAHLDIFAELVRACACYRLDVSRDWDRLPDMIRALIG